LKSYFTQIAILSSTKQEGIEKDEGLWRHCVRKFLTAL